MNYSQYQQLYNKATDEYRKRLGKKPQFRDIAKDTPNPHPITMVLWFGIMILIPLMVFTSVKAGLVGATFNKILFEAIAQKQQIDPLIENLGLVAGVMVFIAMSTAGIIYFTLLSNEDRIVREQKPLKHWYEIFNIRKVYPYLPNIAVYLIVAWLILISSVGYRFDGNLLTFLAEGFQRYLPILLEIVLAELVGTIILQNKLYRDEVIAQLKPRQSEWERKYEDLNSSTFKGILYQLMRQYVTSARFNNGKFVKAEAKDEQEIKREINALYTAFNSSGFDTGEVREEEAKPVLDKRIPPNGAKSWNAITLEADFRKRGLNPALAYTEADLANDYDNGYNARSAFRDGARNYFNA